MTMAANFQSATTLSSSSFTFSRFVMNLTWFQFHSLSAFFPPLWEYSAAPDYLLSKLHWPLRLSLDESSDGGDGGWLEQRAAGHSLTLKLRNIEKSWRMCLLAHTVCANNLFDIILDNYNHQEGLPPPGNPIRWGCYSSGSAGSSLSRFHDAFPEQQTRCWKARLVRSRLNEGILHLLDQLLICSGAWGDFLLSVI